VAADRFVERDVLVGDRLRFVPCGRRAILGLHVHQALAHPADGPCEVHGRGPRPPQARGGLRDRGVRWVDRRGEREPVCGGHADQRRSTHAHRLDRSGDGLDRIQAEDLEGVRQPRLVDDAHAAARRLGPDAAVVLAGDSHALILSPPLYQTPLWGKVAAMPDLWSIAVALVVDQIAIAIATVVALLLPL